MVQAMDVSPNALLEKGQLLLRVLRVSLGVRPGVFSLVDDLGETDRLELREMLAELGQDGLRV